VALEPGDEIEVVAPFSQAVSVPIATLPVGARQSWVVLGNRRCVVMTSASSEVVNLEAPCLRGATFPVLESAQNTSGWHFAYKKGVAPAAGGGTTTVTGLTDWTPATPFVLEVINAPAVVSLDAILGQIAEGQSFSDNERLGIADGGGLTTFALAPGYAEGLQAEVSISRQTPMGPFAARSYAMRVDAGVSGLTLDLAEGFLPAIESLTIDQTTLIRPVASWTSAAPLTSAVGGVLMLPWSGGSWIFVLPPDRLTLTAPELPSELAAWFPDTVQMPGVGFFDGFSSYDEVRATASPQGLTDPPDSDWGLAPTRRPNGVSRTTWILPWD
jgi:hypothetical protein